MRERGKYDKVAGRLELWCPLAVTTCNNAVNRTARVGGTVTDTECVAMAHAEHAPRPEEIAALFYTIRDLEFKIRMRSGPNGKAERIIEY